MQLHLKLYKEKPMDPEYIFLHMNPPVFIKSNVIEDLQQFLDETNRIFRVMYML